MFILLADAMTVGLASTHPLAYIFRTQPWHLSCVVKLSPSIAVLLKLRARLCGEEGLSSKSHNGPAYTAAEALIAAVAPDGKCSMTDAGRVPKNESVFNPILSPFNYPKTEAVVFGLPTATAAAAAATIQVGSNSVAVKPQFKYVGSIVLADGGQDRELQKRLCSAGQVFRSLKANMFSSRKVGLGTKLKFYKYLVLPRLMCHKRRHRVKWP